jgi:DNA-binding CsgD family transcriptional regulator
MQNPRVFAVAKSLQQKANSRNSADRTAPVGRTLVRQFSHENPTPDTQNLTRPSRAKRHLPWEEVELQSHGFYADSLHELAEKFPVLSLMELRVCVLVKGMLRSWEIAERLAIDIKTVENHRINIRKKLGLRAEENLQRHLLTKI